MAKAKAQVDPFPNEDQSWCLSQIFLLWVHPLIRKGWVGELDAVTMAPELRDYLRTEVVTAKIQAAWTAEQAVTKRPASLWRALLKIMTRDLALGTACSGVQGILSTVLRPIVLAMLIRTIQKQQADVGTQSETISVVAFFAAVTLLDNLTKTFSFQKVNVSAAAQFTAASSSLVFHKMLTGKLNSGEVKTSTQAAAAGKDAAGKDGKAAPRRAEAIVNLVGTDVIGIREQCMVLGMMAWALVGAVGALVMIFLTIGFLPGIAGLAVNAFFITASSVLAKTLKVVEQKRTAASDSRMQVRFVLKMMDFVLKMVDFMLKMMGFALKSMDFAEPRAAD